MSTTAPPAFWAASPYDRPRPRATTPRGPAPATAQAAAPASVGRMTSARLAAVRPQPVSSAPAWAGSGSPRIDADGEQHDPDGSEGEDGSVAEDQVLRRAALAGVEQQ